MRGRALAFGKVHQQRIELDHLDLPGDARDFPPNHPDPLLDRKHRLLRRVGRHSDYELVDQVSATQYPPVSRTTPLG